MAFKPEDFKGDKPLREHISPEGVEESIILDVRYMITQTAGGKFRLYNLDPMSQKYVASTIHDSFEKARQDFGLTMSLVGNMFVDPAGTVDKLMSAIADAKGKKK